MNLAISAIMAQDANSPGTSASHMQEKRKAEVEALNELRAKWLEFGKRKIEAPAPRNLRPHTALLPPDIEAQIETKMSAPERESMARRTTTSFLEPEVLRSANGELNVTLVAGYALNRIGDDPVSLRSYNGNLVGPTLRTRPGDMLRIVLKNAMEPEQEHAGMMNKLHGFNTTNLHTHGLHVSPAGISDNVLIAIGPHATQEYQIEIPANHPAGTFWYHAHRHGSTAGNVASAMSGALIIEGGLDEVPEIKAARERVLVLNQIPYVYKDIIDPQTGEVIAKFDLPEGRVEVEYAQYIFGPGDWQRLGRFTTVNGVQLPVLRMRPGAIERWRIIDSGQRERIELKLMRSAGTNSAAPEGLSFHEIALDGLPLGKKVRRDTIELWPGYRSDVLVQAPAAPGEYLLLDEETPAEVSLNGVAESRKHIAKIVVEGEPMAAMKLPEDAMLAKLRLPSIEAGEVTGKQEAIYGIVPNPNSPGVLFTVNGRPLDMDQARRLTLGKVDEWTLASRNNVGVPVHHPFHIHVNPFEIFSITDESGKEQITEPVWRDTIILKEGWTVRMRTRYEDFTGLFVHHCHILDHEDQGMMELVEIINPKGAGASLQRVPRPQVAPLWQLPDTMGAPRSLTDLRGKPAALFFFEGPDCVWCAGQIGRLATRAAEFRQKGIALVAISYGSSEALRAGIGKAGTAFPIMADADGSVFRAYGCFAGGPLHGVFILDADGATRWQAVGTRPLMAFDAILEAATQLVPKIALEGPKTAEAPDQ